MPIYAYRCSNCGHAQDVLQRMSDPVLSVCPACGQPTYVKQVTAAGFQLKGSGWYVTDFRGDKKAAPAADADKAAAKDGDAAAAGAERRPTAPRPAATPARRTAMPARSRTPPRARPPRRARRPRPRRRAAATGKSAD